MTVRRRLAHPALRDYVRSFSERTAVVTGCAISAPLPARADQLIELYIEDRYGVSRDDGPTRFAPGMAIVGPQSRAGTRLHLSGSFKVFTIHFQPSGISALFGLATSELTDQGLEARLVIGPCASGLRSGLMLAPDFEARVDAAQRWLLDRMRGAKPVDRVGRIAAALLGCGGAMPVADLARRVGLSDRQFTRRFERQTGLTPKLFARVVRFGATLEARSKAPESSWTSLSYDMGYADQSHFIRDSRQLGGAAPRQFYRDWSRLA